jgi:hypothetical protein
MKNISLIKVTIAVIATALASSLVSAKVIMPENISDSNIIEPKPLSQKSIADLKASAPLPKNINFEELDLNKNDSLSLTEVENNSLIHDAFTHIDMNSDATISKEEFTTYITK